MNKIDLKEKWIILKQQNIPQHVTDNLPEFS